MSDFWLSTGWLIPLYPLIGALLSLPWSPGLIRRTGPRPAGYLNLLTTLLAFLHSIAGLMAAWGQRAVYFELSWLQVADLNIVLPFELSALSMGAAVVITGLNLLVQIYAIGYLEMDWGWARFYALLALFEAGMTALVLGDSVFFSYMLLEILTLGTYLIVGYWFNQPLVVTGARDAFLTKRVGDLILLMGVIAIYPLAGTWSFSELAAWVQQADLSPTTAALLGLGLLAGPMSKCAQFPLHLWLDEAMEGPLPTSILRNATVVPVGAWVLIKLVPVLALSPLACQAAIAVGAITAVGSGLIACAQIDVKRVLSYLVSAYMGLVFVAVGALQAGAAFFLLLTYAIAMATLMAAAGSVILTCITQDLTQLGGLWSRRPVTGLSFLIGTLGFIAMPPLGGFWSMRLLVDNLWQAGDWGLVLLVIGVNWLMAFSLMRAFALMFVGPSQVMSDRAPEPIWSVVLPMAAMAGLTLHVPIVLQSLALVPVWQLAVNNVGILLLWSSLTGATISYLLYRNRQQISPQLLPQWLVDLFAYDFYTPTLYRNTVVLAVGALAKLGDWLDRYVVDGLVNFVGLASLVGGETLKYGNTGRSQFYILTIAIGTVLLGLFMGWLYLPLSAGL
ncbi:MAG: NAD(P)H-quinone oxidoreductase subunit F [Leptolyngbya sp. SIO4C1]|nr:NAD(P)H-quinone oxidoreductase subunit F [Leptolyngbya sp. SIO4C1]